MANLFEDLIPQQRDAATDVAAAALGLTGAQDPVARFAVGQPAKPRAPAASAGNIFEDLVPGPHVTGQQMAAANASLSQIGLAPEASDIGTDNVADVVRNVGSLMKQGANSVASAAIGAPVTLANMATALPRAATDIANAARGKLGLPAADQVFQPMAQPAAVVGTQQGIAEETAREAEQYQSDAALQYQAELANQGGFTDTLAYLIKNPMAAAYIGAQQAPQVATAYVPGVGAAGNIAAGALNAGFQNADQTAQALRQGGATDEQQIAGTSANAALASTILNSVLPLAGGDAAQVIERGMSGGARQATTEPLLQAILKGVAGEGVQGAASEGGDQVIQNLATGAPVLDQVGQNAALGALLEGPLGGVAAAAENVATRPNPQAQAEIPGAIARALEMMQQQAAEAPPPAQAPEATEQPASPPARRTAPQASQAIDDRIAELERLSQDDGADVPALNARAEEIRQTLAREERLRRDNIKRADPGSAPDVEALAAEQEDLRVLQERARTTQGYRGQLDALRTRLGNIDSDADLLALADEISPAGQPSAAQPVPRAPRQGASAVQEVPEIFMDPQDRRETDATIEARPQEFDEEPASPVVKPARAPAARQPAQAPRAGAAAAEAVATGRGEAESDPLAPRQPDVEPVPEGMDLKGARDAYAAAQSDGEKARAAGWIAELRGTQRQPTASRPATQSKPTGFRSGSEDARVSAALGPAAVGVQLHDTVDTVPERMRAALTEEGNRDVEGFYDPETGESHVIEDRLDTRTMSRDDRRVWVAAHERTLHAGLRSIIQEKTGGGAAARTEMGTILARAKQNPTVAAVTKAMGGQRPEQGDALVEEALAELAAAVRTGNYGEIEGRYGVKVPEAQRATLKGYIQRLVQAIKKHLGMGDKVSDREIYRLIEDSNRQARTRGVTPTGRGARVDQRTYHGTPTRDIDRLSTEFMGKGEGNQAFGWGVYTAGSRDVADTYRKGLSAVGHMPGGFLADKLMQKYGSRRTVLEVISRMRRAGAKAADRSMGELRWSTSGEPSQDDRRMNQELASAEGFLRAESNRGALYQQEVPEDNEVLDWDAPMSQQPEQVRRALRSVQGGELFRDSMQPFEDTTGAGIYHALSMDLGSDRKASEALGAAGIPGLRYLDGQSRYSGEEPTYNHVTWDNERIGQSEALIASRAPPVDSPEFKRWFGDSQVVDNNGAPQIVYHGSPDARFMQDDAVFKNLNERYGKEGGDRAFWFAADRRTATSYADDRRAFDYQNADAAVVPAYLKIENPLEVDGQGKEWREAQQRGKTSDVIDQAREEGRDGVIIRNVRDDYTGLGRGSSSRATDTFVVFDSRQIKSADNNSGAFDPDDPSILASRKTPQQAAQQQAGTYSQLNAMGYASGSPTQNAQTGRFDSLRQAADRVRTTAQDKMLPVLRAQEEAGAGSAPGQTGIGMADAMNVYRLENLMHGRAKDQVDHLNETIVQPIQRAMKNSGLTPDQLQDYLLAMHAPERNAQVASLGGNAMQDGAAGITTQEAADILAGKIDGPYSKAKLTAADIAKAKPIAALLQQARRLTLDNMVASGQMDVAERASLLQTYKHYVPLRGQDKKGFAGEPTSPGTGRGLTTAKNPIKRALGRGKGNLAKNILGEMVGDAQRSIVTKEKANVGRAMLRLAMAHPNPDLYTVEPVDLEWKFSESTGEVYLGVRSSAEDAERSIIVRHNGNPVRIRFEDEQIRDAMMNMGQADLGAFVKVVGSINRWRSAVLTRFNPAFTPINVLRDIQFGTAGLWAERGAAFTARALRDYPLATKAAFQDQGPNRGNSAVPDAQKTMGDWMREATEAGMKTGLTQVDDVEDLQKRMAVASMTLMRLAASGKPVRALYESARRPLALLAENIERVNDATENALRLATYVNDRRDGKTPEQAAEYAKNLTINFNRRGKIGPLMNSVFLFYNASIQGGHAAVRVMRNPKVLGALAALAALQGIFAEHLMDDDDDKDGVTTWDAIPDYVKRTSFIIPLGDKAYFALPMPFGFNLFPYAGGRLVQRFKMGARETDTNVLADLVKTTTDAFSPLPITEGAQSMFGDQVSLMMQLASNQDDLGRPITQENPYSDYEIPKAILGRPDTPSAYALTAQLLAKLGGGDLKERKPPVGFLDVSPEQVELIVNYLGGGLTGLASKATRWWEQNDAGNQPDTMTKLASFPILSRLVGVARDDQAVAARYYAERGLLSRKSDVIDDKVKKGADPEKAQAEAAAKDPTLGGQAVTKYKRDGKRPDGSAYKKGEIRRTSTGAAMTSVDDLSPLGAMRDSEKATKDLNKSIRELREGGMTNAQVFEMVAGMPGPNNKPYNIADLGLPQNYAKDAKAPTRIINRAIKLVQGARTGAQRKTLQAIKDARDTKKAAK